MNNLINKLKYSFEKILSWTEGIERNIFCNSDD